MEINAIYEGDNLEVLNKFDTNSIDLIYLDPPFFSNRHYEVIWNDGAEKRSFQDRWQGGIEHYITWMEPRLRECWRILKETGSVYVHCDWHADAHLRILMDKIFGENHFLNEIAWCYKSGGASKSHFSRKHDTILFYSKTDRYTFNIQKEKSYNRDFKPYHFKGVEEFKDSIGWYTMVMMKDYWEIDMVGRTSSERTGYPTQKPIALLERIVAASSKKGDIVLDPFCGCGTTLMAAQKLGRRWIGIDISPTACKLVAKRLNHELAIKPKLIKGDVDIKYIKKLPPFEFQNWVVVDKFLGTVSKTKSGDKGVDGFTSMVTGGYPIQVKQSEGAGRNVIDNFKAAIERAKKKKGYIVAYSFGSGAYEEVARLKNQEGIEIILRTAEELLKGKTE